MVDKSVQYEQQPITAFAPAPIPIPVPVPVPVLIPPPPPPSPSKHHEIQALTTIEEPNDSCYCNLENTICYSENEDWGAMYDTEISYQSTTTTRMCTEGVNNVNCFQSPNEITLIWKTEKGRKLSATFFNEEAACWVFVLKQLNK